MIVVMTVHGERSIPNSAKIELLKEESSTGHDVSRWVVRDSNSEIIAMFAVASVVGWWKM